MHYLFFCPFFLSNIEFRPQTFSFALADHGAYFHKVLIELSYGWMCSSEERKQLFRPPIIGGTQQTDVRCRPGSVAVTVFFFSIFFQEVNCF